MNRRSFLKMSSTVASSVFLARCSGSVSSPSELTNNLTSPLQSNPNTTIDTSKVGQLRYSVKSPLTGNLYFDVFPKLNLAISTRRYERDRLTETVLNGYAVISVNGDPGPEMVNVFGEKTYVGYVVGVGNKHGFYNSIMDVQIEKYEQIDFYHALPCSANPYAC